MGSAIADICNIAYYNQNKRNMKKLLSTTLLFLVVSLLCSCSGDNNNDNSPAKSSVESLIVGKWVVAKHKATLSYNTWYDTDGKMTLSFQKDGSMTTNGSSEYIVTMDDGGTKKELSRTKITHFDGCYQWSVGDIKTKNGLTEFFFPMYYKTNGKESYRGWHAQLQQNGDLMIEWTSTQITYLLRKVNN